MSKISGQYDYSPNDVTVCAMWERRLGHAIPKPGSQTLAEDIAMTRPELRDQLASLATELYE